VTTWCARSCAAPQPGTFSLKSRFPSHLPVKYRFTVPHPSPADPTCQLPPQLFSPYSADLFAPIRLLLTRVLRSHPPCSFIPVCLKFFSAFFVLFRFNFPSSTPLTSPSLFFGICRVRRQGDPSRFVAFSVLFQQCSRFSYLFRLLVISVFYDAGHFNRKPPAPHSSPPPTTSTPGFYCPRFFPPPFSPAVVFANWRCFFLILHFFFFTDVPVLSFFWPFRRAVPSPCFLMWTSWRCYRIVATTLEVTSS